MPNRHGQSRNLSCKSCSSCLFPFRTPHSSSIPNPSLTLRLTPPIVVANYPDDMRTRAILFALITTAVVLTNAIAATYSLQPVADARVIDIPGDTTVNFGGDFLSVYTAVGNVQRSLIQFDLSSITLATNETVQSATLTLIASTDFGFNDTQQPMEIYRVLSPWTETGVTWSNRDATDAWINGGGDFIGTNGLPYAVSTLSPTNGQPVTWDVTALVQEWLTHASTNNGLLLKSENGNALTFAARESDPSTRPNLTVITGLAPLYIRSSGSQVQVWWTSTNSVLQEKTNLNPAIAWGDSLRAVAHSNGTNSVTISPPTGNDFFRLRGGP